MGDYPHKMENSWAGDHITCKCEGREKKLTALSEWMIQHVDCSEHSYAICPLQLQVIMHIETNSQPINVFFVFFSSTVFTSYALPVNLQYNAQMNCYNI